MHELIEVETRAFQKRLSVLLAAITANPGISGTELNLASKRMSVEDRREALDTLLARGAIFKEPNCAGKGRRKWMYWVERRPGTASREFLLGKLDGLRFAVDAAKRLGARKLAEQFYEALEDAYNDADFELSASEQAHALTLSIGKSEDAA